jgi:dihydroorotase-like cyclic amidohydrolase
VLDCVIHGCRIVSRDNSYDGWIAIDDGVIVAVGSEPSGLPPARKAVDASGLIALPGRIDPHIHIGIHGADMAADIEKVSRLAAVGGTTTLMPLNRSKTSYHELYPGWADAVQQRSVCDFLFHLQIQIRDHISEIAEYRERYGVACFKLHFDYRTDDPVICPMDIAHVDDGDLYLTMVEVARHGGLVAVHCENTHIASRTAAKVRAQGRNDLLAWGDAKPAICEALDVDLVGAMANQVGCKAIAVHVSSESALHAAARYPADVLALETTVAFLTMTLDEADRRVGMAAKGNPPLRSQSDVNALWRGLASGRIRTVGTDNVLRETAPGTTIWDTGVGHCSMEFAIPLLITYGVKAGRISLEDLAGLMCDNPARLYGIDDRKRGLVPGGDADIVLVDLEETRTVSPETSYTGFRTIVDGLDLQGWPKMTFLRGTMTYDGTKPVDAGLGKALRSTM